MAAFSFSFTHLFRSGNLRVKSAHQWKMMEAELLPSNCQRKWWWWRWRLQSIHWLILRTRIKIYSRIIRQIYRREKEREPNKTNSIVYNKTINSLVFDNTVFGLANRIKNKNKKRPPFCRLTHSDFVKVMIFLWLKSNELAMLPFTRLK